MATTKGKRGDNTVQAANRKAEAEKEEEGVIINVEEPTRKESDDGSDARKYKVWVISLSSSSSLS